MLKYYKGPLGNFEYDDVEFRVFTYGVIKYIGKETDGTKIKIPEGILDCSYMFETCNLITPPVIPAGNLMPYARAAPLSIVHIPPGPIPKRTHGFTA